MRRWPVRAARLAAEWDRSGLTSTAMGAAGFAFGVAMTRVGVGATPSSAAFAGTATFSVWSAVTGFEVALWAICWVRARTVVRDVRHRLPPAPVWPFVVVLLVLVAAARTALFLYPTIVTPLHGMAVRQVVLQCVALLAAVPALVGIARIQAWLRGPAAPPSRLSAAGTPGRMVADLVFARQALLRLLFLLSLMIAAVVVATGALRSAFVAAGLPPADFPAVGVLLFGALLSAALALLFVPVYVDLRDHQRKVRDLLSPVPDDGVPSEGWHAERERLTALLGLDSGAVDTVRTVTLLLGPFLTALATLVPGLRG